MDVHLEIDLLHVEVLDRLELGILTKQTVIRGSRPFDHGVGNYAPRD